MSDYPDILILRHGETEWNRAGRMQGDQDSPLTDTGRAQARRQGALLAASGCDGYQWFSSPQGRALASVAARTLAFLETLTGASVIVTHGITSRILRCHLLGQPWETFDQLEGGQGVIYRIRKRQQERLS